MSFLSIACVLFVVIAASDFPVFLNFVYHIHLPTSSLLFISNAKSMLRLRICVNSIPVNRSSLVDAFILSRLTQISGRRGRDLSQPGSNKYSSV